MKIKSYVAEVSKTKTKNSATYSDHEDSLTNVTNAIIYQAGRINELILIHRLRGVCTQGLYGRLHLLCEPWHD